MEEAGVPRENYLAARVIDKLHHIMLYQVHLTLAVFKLTTLLVIDTDYEGSCNSNYYAITITTAPSLYVEPRENLSLNLTHNYSEKMKQTNMHIFRIPRTALRQNTKKGQRI